MPTMGSPDFVRIRLRALVLEKTPIKVFETLNPIGALFPKAYGIFRILYTELSYMAPTTNGFSAFAPQLPRKGSVLGSKGVDFCLM